MTAGRDRFAAVALEHLARAVAADELGVTLRDVRVTVRDARGALAVRVASPIAVPSLGGGAGERVPVAAGLTEAGMHIRARLGALTGMEVARVDIRATTAVIAERRVR
jgi:hypothetical protein